MMNLFISLSETDKRALIILVILLVVFLILIALIGVAVRKTMIYQSKRADTMMHDVTITHVVDTPKAFLNLGRRKNNRLLYRQSIPAFLLALLATIILIIGNLVNGRWGDNIFAVTGELFFAYDFDSAIVHVFGIPLIGNWPAVIHSPEFHIENLYVYMETLFYVAAIIVEAVACQAYISRWQMLHSRARTVFSKSLDGYNASDDIKVKRDKPLPPSD